MRPAASPSSAARPRATARAREEEEVGSRGRSHTRLRNPVLPAKAREVLAHPRALALPAADTDVDVIPLREHPAVAARHVRELEEEPAAVLLFVDDAVRNVAFEGNAVYAALVEADRPGSDAVRSVRAKQPICSNLVTGDRCSHAVVDEGDVLHAHAVAEISPGVGRPLGEVRVEPASLGHQNERLVGGALEARDGNRAPA